LVGGGPIVTNYGFRKVPHSSRLAVRLGVASAASGLNADFLGDFRGEHPRRRLLLRAGYSHVEVLRYFGVGNETVRDQPRDFYYVRHQQLWLDPTLEWGFGSSGVVALGGFVRRSDSDVDEPTLLAQQRPYGSGQFTEGGFTAAIRVDTRNHPRYPTRGITAELRGRLVPSWFDVTETFGGLGATATAFVTGTRLPATPTVALRAGVSHDWGRVPFFDASAIGGRSSVRGLNSRRFIGRGSAFGGIELRLDVGSLTVIVPGEWGIYGLADAGRVYVDGEDSDRWHTAAGGGLWFSLLDRRSTMTVTYAASGERSKIYVQAGFHF
jgi:hypothetical protein